MCVCVCEKETEREGGRERLKDLAHFANYSKYILLMSKDSVLDVSSCDTVQSKE